MRVAVFGDFNGDHFWLQRLLKQTENERIDKRICHGDIARKLSKHETDKTQKCIILLNDYGVECCRGNNEREILDNLEKANIDTDSIAFFRKLPQHLILGELPHVLFCHKSPGGRFLIGAKKDEFEIMENDFSDQRIAFFGHSHIRFHHHKQQGKIHSNYFPKFNTLYDVSSGIHLVNTGTTNRNFPFSFNIRPGYVIYDSDNQTIEFKRIKVRD